MFNNYMYIIHDNKVIAISTYAGKRVKGVAKCHPNDTWDLEFGKKLAAARCNLKVARKRFKRAEFEYKQNADMMEEVHKIFQKSCKYYSDSYNKYKEAIDELNDVLGVEIK